MTTTLLPSIRSIYGALLMARTAETNYRVYYMSSTLIAVWRKARDKQGSTNLAFITEATCKHLPSVVKELRAVGLTAPAANRHAVRLEVPLSVLVDLAAAAEMTGVPANRLFAVCMCRASTTKRRRN